MNSICLYLFVSMIFDWHISKRLINSLWTQSLPISHAISNECHRLGDKQFIKSSRFCWQLSSNETNVGSIVVITALDDSSQYILLELAVDFYVPIFEKYLFTDCCVELRNKNRTTNKRCCRYCSMGSLLQLFYSSHSHLCVSMHWAFSPTG